MLMIISPAKTLDFETPVTTESYSIPDYLEKSAELVDIMKKKSLRDLVNMMQVSQKIAELNVERFKSWKLPFSSGNARQALLAFKGDVYTGLDTATLSEENFDYAQSHLRILSGLYGLLRPLDLIQPYRLEMGLKLNSIKTNTLYQFWGEKITDGLNTLLEEQEKPIDNWRVPYDYTGDRPYLQLPVPPPSEKDESKKGAVPEEKRVIIIDL